MKLVSLLVLLAATITVGTTWAAEIPNDVLRTHIQEDVTYVYSPVGSFALCAEGARCATPTDGGSGSPWTADAGTCTGTDCKDIAVAGAGCTAALPKEHATIPQEVPHALGE